MMRELVPQFSPSSATFGDVTVIGCWFHFAQSIIKRVHKVGLKDEYINEPDVQDIVRCLLGLPLLPAEEICPAFDEVLTGSK